MTLRKPLPYSAYGLPVTPELSSFQLPDGRTIETADFNPGGTGKPVLLAHGRGHIHDAAWNFFADALIKRGYHPKSFANTTHAGSSPTRTSRLEPRPQHIVSPEDQVHQLDAAARHLFPDEKPLIISQSFYGLFSALYMQGRPELPEPHAAGHVGLGSLAEATMALPVGPLKIPLNYPMAELLTGAIQSLRGKGDEARAPNPLRDALLGIEAQQEAGAPSQTRDHKKFEAYADFLLTNFLVSTDEPTFGTLRAFFEGRRMAMDDRYASMPKPPQGFVIGGEDKINKPPATAAMAKANGAEEFWIPEAKHDFPLAEDSVQKQVLDYIDDFVRRKGLFEKTRVHRITDPDNTVRPFVKLRTRPEPVAP